MGLPLTRFPPDHLLIHLDPHPGSCEELDMPVFDLKEFRVQHVRVDINIGVVSLQGVIWGLLPERLHVRRGSFPG